MKSPSSVKDYMAKNLVTFSPETNVLSAIRTLLRHKISGAPVVDDNNQVIGMVSEKDCLQTFLGSSYYNEMGELVSEIMTSPVITVDANASIIEVAEKFLKNNFRRFPVLEQGELIGQISRRDILKAIKKIRKH
ncbi:MAG: CBS domain-containing protein [Candidatus Neomarinimicrobiota bacterium]